MWYMWYTEEFYWDLIGMSDLNSVRLEFIPRVTEVLAQT